MLKTVLLHSLEKVFPDSAFVDNTHVAFSAMRNEPLSLQVAYRIEDEPPKTVPIYATVEADIPITMYAEGYVPLMMGVDDTPFTERYTAGLFADPLLPKQAKPEIGHVDCPHVHEYAEVGEDTVLRASTAGWQALWLTVNEDGEPIPAGEYTVSVKFYCKWNNAHMGTATTTVKIVNAQLPEQRLYNTNWVHADMIARTYGVEIFSDRFFEIFENHIRPAGKHGMNMILLPAFTPALDTPMGTERFPAQLVSVTLKDGEYTFDFALVKRYIDICRKCNIPYFEHCHFFSQWGAECAPNIYATVDGEHKRIFGWDTSSTSPEYCKFLRAYITEFKKFMDKEDLHGKVLFHISDEPHGDQIINYRAAKAQIIDLLKDEMMGDALSEFSFYEDGTVQIPIVSTGHIHTFLGKCDNLWCYYTAYAGYNDKEEVRMKASNRLINNSSERNRILGVQMYYHHIKGFLHWGYNYYSTTLTQGFFNPLINPEMFQGNPGHSYFIYPNPDGTCLQSIRQKVFFEGILDVRALELLESLVGREQTVALIEQHYGKVTFATEAESGDRLLTFRNAVNDAIAAAVQK